MKRALFILIISLVTLVGLYTFIWNAEKIRYSRAFERMMPEVAGCNKFLSGFIFSQQIGGDKFDVTNVVPSGAEPHDYERRRKIWADGKG